MPAAKSTLRILANLVIALATSLGMGCQKDKAMEQPVFYRIVKVDGLNIFYREKQGRKMRPPFSYCTAFRRPGGDREPHSDDGR
jgi:hypothetical protein